MAHDIVRVTFVDAATGAAFATADLAVGQLPESFAPATTLHLGDGDWSVVSADPPTAEAFAATGALTLTLSRVTAVDPKDLLFSLPTIEDALPPPADGPAPPSALRLREDDWRQVELVSEDFGGEVERELADVRAIVDATTVAASGFRAFRTLHVRRRVPAPLGVGLPFSELASRLPTVARNLGGVGFDGDPRGARGGFAFALSGATLYGLREGDAVTALGLYEGDSADRDATLETARFLADLMAANRLVLVDWVGCGVVRAVAEALADYLER